jgi:hypothetical protein
VSASSALRIGTEEATASSCTPQVRVCKRSSHSSCILPSPTHGPVERHRHAADSRHRPAGRTSPTGDVSASHSHSPGPGARLVVVREKNLAQNRERGAKPSRQPATAGRRPLGAHVGKCCNFCVIWSVPSVASVARRGAAWCLPAATAWSLRSQATPTCRTVLSMSDGTAIARAVLVARGHAARAPRKEVQASHGTRRTTGERRRSDEARHEAGEAFLGISGVDGI